jgi:hypothetical protein
MTAPESAHARDFLAKRYVALVAKRRDERAALVEWLTSRADSYDADARSQEQAVPGVPEKVSGGMTALQPRAIACELRDAAVDLQGRAE